METRIESALKNVRKEVPTENQVWDLFHRIETSTRKKLANGYTSGQTQILNPSGLDPNKIYHENHIRSVCTNYRLRFLDTKHFKDELPYEALVKWREVESKAEVSHPRFFIMAPKERFNLTNKDTDPLLFLSMGKGQYYLIHQWGNDLSVWRKILHWPYKSMGHLIFTLACLVLTISLSIPGEWISTQPELIGLSRAYLFFYLFIALGGLTIFYSFALNKNFSSATWNSKYL